MVQIWVLILSIVLSLGVGALAAYFMFNKGQEKGKEIVEQKYVQLGKDATKIIDDAKALWDTQSKEVKLKFNNDFKQFIAGSENGQIVNMLNEELKTKHEQQKMPSYQDILATMQKQNEMIANLTAVKQQEQK